MLGVKARNFREHDRVCLENFVPSTHFYRQLDHKLDLSFVRTLLQDKYCGWNGRPSLDPVVFFKLQLIMFFEDIRSERLFGWLYGDKGYLSQDLVRQLFQTQRLYLVTKVRRNMKNHLLPLSDRLMLRKRAILETITDQLKNISQIEHTRHRSFTNFCVNLLAGLIAYCHQPKKPTLHLDPHPRLETLIPN